MAAATDNIGVAKRAMKQKAVLWPPSGLDEFGKPTSSTPEEIDCRWEDSVEEFIDANGERQVSRSRLMVDRDIPVKAFLKLGELDSTIAEGPADNPNAWEVRLAMKTPNFKGSKFLREVYL